MAKSIKLDDDKYWDTSGLYGSRILQRLGTISAGETKTITIPGDTYGMLMLVQNNEKQGFYTFNCNSGGSVRINTISSITAAPATAGTNAVTVANFGTIVITVLALATRLLTIA